MSDDRKQQVSGAVSASPEAVFALLSDPARHARVSVEQMQASIARVGEAAGPPTPDDPRPASRHADSRGFRGWGGRGSSGGG